MSKAIGIMEGAFFVSRGDILIWVNELLKLDLVKIEQTASGAVACQVIDAIYPGSVPIHKVNWKATQEYEFINNYKILQQAFAKHKITKVIEVERLSKGKYQDNLEFMQWLKRFYDLNASKGAAYDAVGRRKSVAPPPAAEKPPAPKPTGIRKKSLEKPSAEKPAVEEAKKEAEGYKIERDFYFGKLRNIEMLLEFHEKDVTPFFEKVKKILFATEDQKIEIDTKGEVIMKEEGSSPEKSKQ